MKFKETLKDIVKDPFFFFMVIWVLVMLLIIWIPVKESKKYSITAPDFRMYYVDKYTETNNSVQFIKNNKEYKFNGTYEIIKYK